jgi:elongation factor P hydroxylase
MHHYQDLIHIFSDCFEINYNTRLVKGDEEPVYLPADRCTPYHQIVFAHGFFSSALHECAHWLIAGAKRRQLVDYGYWYAPDGRTEAQQVLFQHVEIKPQALEWILSEATNYPFQLSLDNLSGGAVDTSGFKQAVCAQVQHYYDQGLSPRALKFYRALKAFYG